jgi:hypothetical protein
MFAPKMAKPEAKATASSTSDLAHQRSTLMARRPAVQEALLLPRTIGNPAMLRPPAQRASNPIGNEPNLRISAPGDIHEQEADRIARQVLTKPMDPRVGATARIQHQSEQATAGMEAAPASVERVLASPGRPLELTLRQDMERRFAQDFSRVRVHSGTQAEQSARDVNARAYTVGHSIVFGAGKFAPETRAGQGLLAHELAHVVQRQTGAEANVVRRNNGFDDEPTVVEPRQPPRGHVEKSGEIYPGNETKGEIVEKKPPSGGGGGGGGGRGAATFELGRVGALDAAFFYLQIHAAHFAALEAVSNKVAIAKDLLSHVAEFEDGARQLRGAVNKLQGAEAALPTVWQILPTGEQGAPTMVSLGELEHINAYATRASSIVGEAFDARVRLNKIINGWDAVVAQGEATRDFTRKAVVEATQMLDLRFSKEKGGSFRAFLVAARDDAGRVEAWARSKWYEAKDILDTANLPLRRAMNEAASIRSELIAIARRGPASAGVRVAIDSLKTAQEEGSLSVMLEKVEFSINVLHGIPEGAHATTRLLLLQKQLQGMSSD